MGVSPLRNPLYQTTLKKKLKGHHVLRNATLSGAILSNTNLLDADLRGAKGELGLTSLHIRQVGTKGGMPQDLVEQAEKLFKDYFWKQWAEHTQRP
jgi:uncharacterized protein YjbI with pentapeptide repeats